MISARQITAARALLGLTQEQLADAASTSPNTINKFEKGDGIPFDNLQSICAVLERKGIKFVGKNGVIRRSVGMKTYEGISDSCPSALMEHTTFQDLNEWWSSKEAATDDAVLNKLEQTSIRALASYTAYEYGVSEDLVITIVAAHFGVKDISQLRRMNFDSVLRYLLDVN